MSVSLLILSFSEDVSGRGSPVDPRLGESSLLVLHVEMVEVGRSPVLRQQVCPGAWPGVGEDGGWSGVVGPVMEQSAVRRRRRGRGGGLVLPGPGLVCVTLSALTVSPGSAE